MVNSPRLNQGLSIHKQIDNEKVPYDIFLKNKELFGFAGLYDTWHDKEGKELTTYTIITTEPNALVEPIYNRMPVILEKRDEAEWLNPDETEADRLVKLLSPYPQVRWTHTLSRAWSMLRKMTPKK